MSNAVKEALERAIRSVVPSAEIDIHEFHGHWSGTVIAREFDEMTLAERQRKLWERITCDLGSNTVEVGTLSLYSPVEAEALNSDD